MTKKLSLALIFGGSLIVLGSGGYALLSGTPLSVLGAIGGMLVISLGLFTSKKKEAQQ